MRGTIHLLVCGAEGDGLRREALRERLERCDVVFGSDELSALLESGKAARLPLPTPLENAVPLLRVASDRGLEVGVLLRGAVEAEMLAKALLRALPEEGLLVRD